MMDNKIKHIRNDIQKPGMTPKQWKRKLRRNLNRIEKLNALSDAKQAE